MTTPEARSDEEKRQAVVFAARYRYSQQRFVIAGTDEQWEGDPFNLPQGVEPLMTPAERRAIWRAALPPSKTEAEVDAYQYKHWCGATALVCLHDAGLALDVFWKDSVGFCYPSGMRMVTRPEPGDVAWFEKNQHYAVVEAVRGNLLDTIDGNQGKTLARPCIGLRTRPLSSAKLFFSIDKFFGAP